MHNRRWFLTAICLRVHMGIHKKKHMKHPTPQTHTHSHIYTFLKAIIHNISINWHFIMSVQDSGMLKITVCCADDCFSDSPLPSLCLLYFSHESHNTLRVPWSSTQNCVTLTNSDTLSQYLVYQSRSACVWKNKFRACPVLVWVLAS